MHTYSAGTQPMEEAMKGLRVLCLITAVLTAATLLATSAFGAGLVNHSGSVVSVAPERLVLHEVGPWRLKNGETEVIRVTVELTKDTAYVVARRADEAPSGFARDFVERDIDAADVRAGDFVTVECEHRGARMIARRIVVFEPEP
jgi:hypothetical protein